MSVKPCHLIPAACELFVQPGKKENITAPHHWPFCEGNLPVTGGSTHKGSVVRKASPCYDVTMYHPHAGVATGFFVLADDQTNEGWGVKSNYSAFSTQRVKLFVSHQHNNENDFFHLCTFKQPFLIFLFWSYHHMRNPKYNQQYNKVRIKWGIFSESRGFEFPGTDHWSAYDLECTFTENIK